MLRTLAQLHNKSACLQVDDAGNKLQGACEPLVQMASAAFAPIKRQLPTLQTPALASDNAVSELARRMKVKLQG